MARTQGLPVRMAPHTRAVIEEAAQLHNLSLSRYLEQAAYQKALKDLDEHAERRALQALTDTLAS